MAKDLVRTRHHAKKFMLMRANIQAVSMKIQTLRSQNAMAEAMKGVTRAMQSMNRYNRSEENHTFKMHTWLVNFLIPVLFFRQLKLPQIQKILQEFEKQSEIMDMKEEMMNDAMDDALGGEEDEDERYWLQS